MEKVWGCLCILFGQYKGSFDIFKECFQDNSFRMNGLPFQTPTNTSITLLTHPSTNIQQLSVRLLSISDHLHHHMKVAYIFSCMVHIPKGLESN